MNEEQLIKLCQFTKDTIVTQPFKDKKDGGLYVVRHKSNNKWFALIFTMEDKLYVNLKCYPDLAAILRDEEPAVDFGWHMNKKHWIKVYVNNISLLGLERLIKISFELTAQKKKIGNNLL